MTDVAVVAGSVATAVFIVSQLPMLTKAFRSKDLSSYSPLNLTLANAGNAVQTVYVVSLPIGPLWGLHAFNVLTSGLMLVWWARYRQRPVDDPGSDLERGEPEFAVPRAVDAQSDIGVGAVAMGAHRVGLADPRPAVDHRLPAARSGGDDADRMPLGGQAAGFDHRADRARIADGVPVGAESRRLEIDQLPGELRGGIQGVAQPGAVGPGHRHVVEHVQPVHGQRNVQLAGRRDGDRGGLRIGVHVEFRDRGHVAHRGGTTHEQDPLDAGRDLRVGAQQ